MQVRRGSIEKDMLFIQLASFEHWVFWLSPCEVWPGVLNLKCREVTYGPNLASISYLLVIWLLTALIFFKCVTTNSPTHLPCEGKKSMRHKQVCNMTLSPFKASTSTTKDLERNIQNGILLFAGWRTSHEVQTLNELFSIWALWSTITPNLAEK